MGGLSLGGSGKSGVLAESQVVLEVRSRWAQAGLESCQRARAVPEVRSRGAPAGLGSRLRTRVEPGGTDQGVLGCLESQLMVTEVEGAWAKPAGQTARVEPAGQEA